MTPAERLARDTERVAARLRREEVVEEIATVSRAAVWAREGNVTVVVDAYVRALRWARVGDGIRCLDLCPGYDSLRLSGRGWPERLAEEALRVLRGEP